MDAVLCVLLLELPELIDLSELLLWRPSSGRLRDCLGDAPLALAQALALALPELPEADAEPPPPPPLLLETAADASVAGAAASSALAGARGAAAPALTTSTSCWRMPNLVLPLRCAPVYLSWFWMTSFARAGFSPSSRILLIRRALQCRCVRMVVTVMPRTLRACMYLASCSLVL